MRKTGSIICRTAYRIAVIKKGEEYERKKPERNDFEVFENAQERNNAAGGIREIRMLEAFRQDMGFKTRWTQDQFNIDRGQEQTWRVAPGITLQIAGEVNGRTQDVYQQNNRGG